MICVENYEKKNDRKRPLGPDIVEECQAVSRLEEAKSDNWEPLFEPNSFNTRHGPL